MEVKEYEVKEINKYIKEVNGSNSTLIENSGYQLLNGQQALSYSRIRKVGNNDFERTERQRKVIGELIIKAKKTSLIKLSDLFTTVLPFVKTNIPTNKLMNMGYTVYKFGGTAIDNLRIPGDNMFEGMKIYGMDVLVPDLERNMDYLNRFIFSTGGSLASNMPAYMVNNFHADDKAVDKRGRVRIVPQIVIPKPDPEQAPPEGVIVDEEYIDVTPEDNTGNTGETGTGEGYGDTTGETPGTGDAEGEIDNGTTDGGTDTEQPGNDNNGETDTETDTDSGTTDEGSGETDTSGGN